ncbi:MAG: alcohol dehydrogenase catalytic domain-containing protein [Clostridia bacterium]|nr:alcohol dehydrogenase catalytic domain-containing protein [Clostridia bacterium]
MSIAKAAVFHGPGDLRLEAVAKPRCPAGGALVRLTGSMICGSDIKIAKGGHPAIAPPRVLGHEGCGVVEEIDIKAMDGACPGCAIGARVAIEPNIPCGHCPNCQRGRFHICIHSQSLSLHHDGTFAEYLAVPPRALAMGNLIPIGPDISDEQACLAEPLACVLNGQEPLAIRPGESVLVVGAGPIGILHAELALLSGASNVIVAETSPLRLERAKRFGYTHVVDCGAENLRDAVLAATGGRGADVAVVTAPAREPMEQAVNMLDFRGRLSLFSSLTKDSPAITIDSRAVHYKELRIFGASSSAVRHMKQAIAILRSGRIDASRIVTHRLPLSRLAQSIDLAAGREALKVFLDHDHA